MMNQQKQPGLIQKAQAGAFDKVAEVEKMISVMPAKMRQSFEKIVEAGKRVMYGPETREEVMSFLGQDAPLEEKLGTGIANLVILLDNKANGNLPKDVLIPVGTVLLFDLIGVMEESGEDITPQVMSSAYQHMFYGIFSGYGVPPEKLDQLFDEVGAQTQQQQQGQEVQQGGV